MDARHIVKSPRLFVCILSAVACLLATGSKADEPDKAAPPAADSMRGKSLPFCMSCNRIRLTSDGKIRYCLFAIEETDVKGMLRDGSPDEKIAETLRATIRAKWIGHEINAAKFVPPPRPMYSIGG